MQVRAAARLAAAHARAAHLPGAMLCYAMPCHAILCHALLCYPPGARPHLYTAGRRRGRVARAPHSNCRTRRVGLPRRAAELQLSHAPCLPLATPSTAESPLRRAQVLLHDDGMALDPTGGSTLRNKTCAVSHLCERAALRVASLHRAGMSLQAANDTLNLSIQCLCALFNYTATITLPWRAAMP